MAEASGESALEEDGKEKKANLLENKSKDELMTIVKRQLALLQKAKGKSDELKGKCSALERQIESKVQSELEMSEKIKSLEEKLSSRSSKNGTTHAEDEKHLKVKGNKDIPSSVLNEKEEQIECLTLQLDTVKKTCQYLQEELKEMKKNQDERDGFAKSLLCKNFNDMVNFSILYEDLNELKKKHATCFEEKSIFSKIENFKEHLIHFQSEREQLLKQKEAASEQITLLTIEKEAARKSSNANEEICFLISDNQKLLSEVNAIKEENEALKEKLSLSLNTSCQTDQANSDKGTKETDKLQVDYIKIQNALFEMEQLNAELEKDKENLKDENHNIFLQLKQVMADKEHSELQVLELSKNKQELENQIKKLSGISQELSDFKIGYEHALLHGAEAGAFEEDMFITPCPSVENITAPVYDNLNLTSGLETVAPDEGSLCDLNKNLQLNENLPPTEFIHASNKSDHLISENDSAPQNEMQLMSKKLSYYMNELKQLSDENDSLKQKLLEENIKDCSNYLDVGINTDPESCNIDINENRVKELEESIIHLEEENSNLRKKLDSLELKSSDTFKKHEVLLHEYDFLKKDLENSNKTIQELSEENNDLNITIKDLEKKVDNLELVSTDAFKKHEGLLHERSLLKNDIENSNNAIQMLNEENNNLNTTIKDLEKKVENFELVISETYKKYEALFRECNMLKNDLDNSSKTIQKLNEENNNLKITIQDLEKRSVERSEELNCKLEEIKQFNQEFESLVATIVETAKQQTTVQFEKLKIGNLLGLKLFFEEIMIMLNNSNLILKDLQSNLDNLNNQKVELEEKLCHVEELNKFLEEEVKALQEENRNSNYDSSYSSENYDNFYKTKVGHSELYSIEETNESEEKMITAEETDCETVSITSAEPEKEIDCKKVLQSEKVNLNSILKENMNKIEMLSSELSSKEAEVLSYINIISEKEDIIKELEIKHQAVQSVASELKIKIKELELDVNKHRTDIATILKQEQAYFQANSNLMLEKIKAFENYSANQIESLNNYFVNAINDCKKWVNSLERMIEGDNFSSHVDKLHETSKKPFSFDPDGFRNAETFFVNIEEFDLCKGKFTTLLHSYLSEIENQMSTLKIKVKELESGSTEENKLQKSEDADVKAQLTDTETKFKKLKHISLKWKKELEDSKTMCSQLVLEKESMVKELSVLKTERELCNMEHYHYAQNYQSLQTEYDKVQDELESQRKDFKALQEDFNSTLLELNGFKEKLSDTEEQVGKLKEILEASIAAKKESERMYMDLESQLIVAKSKIDEKESKIKDIETTLQAKQNELQITMDGNQNLKTQLDQVLKDESKKNLLDLEMADYERSVSELNTKLTSKETEIFQLKQQLVFEKEKIQSLQEEIESTETLKNTEEKRANDLKEILEKTKVELVSSKEQEVNLLAQVSSLQLQIEILTQQEENYKLQLSESSSEIQIYKEKLKTSSENYQRITSSLESKIAAQKEEILCSHKEVETIKQEFENYKIRVHSVLRQQKSTTLPSVTVELDFKEKLENTIDKLKAQVKELSDKLTAVSLEHETLQDEYENLMQKYNKAIEGMEKKDSEWHLKLEKINAEKYQLRTMQEELASQHLLQNEMLVSTYKKQIKIMSDEHKRAVAELQKQLEMADLEISRLQRDQQKSYPNSVSSQDIPLPFDILLQERQEGEGSECTDERTTPTYQMPLNTIPSTGFVPFEKLLQTPSESEIPVNYKQCHECEKLITELNVTNKKIDHLSEVLNESESTNLRMNEQIRVLKEEVRRLERNREREQHAENLEYLKNVILKFSTLNACAEKAMLIPVLTTMLKLSPAEQQQLKDIAGDVDSADASGSKWGSYLHRWSGLA